MSDARPDQKGDNNALVCQLGALPVAPMAFPVQSLTRADRAGLFARLWAAIAQRVGN